MYDIEIRFNEDFIDFYFDRIIEGSLAMAQEVLINTTTKAGEDRFFPDRGTSLFKDIAQSGIVNLNAAANSANFASTDTVLFIQETNPDDPDLVSSYILQPLSIENRKLRLNALIETIKGDRVGIDKLINRDNGN